DLRRVPLQPARIVPRAAARRPVAPARRVPVARAMGGGTPRMRLPGRRRRAGHRAAARRRSGVRHRVDLRRARVSRDGVTPLAIPGSGPLFEGHFPGRPILPGIVLLHLALGTGAPGEAAGVTEGTGEAALAAIEMLRFRRLVLPGERLEVQWTGG